MHTNQVRRRRIVSLVAAATLAATVVVPAGPTRAVPPEGIGANASFEVEVLSSLPEYVSAGDARIRVAVPRTVPLGQVTVTAGGNDVPSMFAADPATRTLEGVVDGLPLGQSTITVAANGRGKGRPSTSIDVVNHPAQGPMFSGPHQTPFICQTVAAGLGEPDDPDLCTAATQVSYLYRTAAGAFAPLPAGARPADLVTTTTTTGAEVDYIVRLETGVINRAVYQTAVLYDPAVADTDSPGATPGWNRRLIYSYGGGCNAGYRQGTGNGGVLTHEHLSRGYATASSSLNVLDNNCNDVSSAETTSMVKEHFIETYGVDDFTIGWGASGGAISQHMIGQNYPGLLDGIIPTLSYPDPSSIGPGIGDCRLLFRYSQTGALTPSQLAAVSGHFGFDNCVAWTFSFSNRFVADEGCPAALPVELRWHPVDNPDGARCTISDHLVNILGINPDTGVAYTAYDNNGLQYGLEALAEGAISAEDFVGLNEGIGGYDVDGHFQADRTDVDPIGVRRVYATGRVTSGAGGLATTPIIDVRPYLDQVGDIHVRFHSFSMRQRLMAANGHADNQVIQIAGDFGSFAVGAIGALAAMDEWLTNLDADWDERTAADVVAAKPAWLVDGCWDATGIFIAEPASYDSDGTCNTLYPPHGNPRTAAGAPVSNDILKCQLVPLDRTAYPVEFTDDQWARMEAVFPDGVCDHTMPGVAQVPLAGVWQDFG